MTIINRNSGSEPFRILHVEGYRGNLTLRGLTITGGDTEFGGGILNDSNVNLDNVVISGNRAIYHTGYCYGGGGIYQNYPGALNIAYSTIVGNSAIGSDNTRGNCGGGGGIQNFGTVTITHSTISNNEATSYAGGNFGGGGVSQWGTMTITHSTISSNRVVGINGYAKGGGVYNEGTLYVADSAVTENAVINGPGANVAYDGGLYNIGAP